ncbi:hypothetical protein NBRC110019_03360 [Neptunitalea chrysea]|uniref:Sialate O-acetylesterase domain-containing protein n=1 Tax=Neptunitalea chrysea TaxID=1647581 RepID=A0A9W6B4R8_9FLAO|nr:sialate O-acetylesterase [Neptunitalea chrysea]GLB51297.1 hypothetical protein NBRC110019_03360 [Neptunitalea chrysea]
MKIFRTTKFILLIGFILVTIKLHAQDSNFYIFLCFGQSNMEGQGAIEPVDTIANSRFKLLEAMDCPNLNREMGKWYNATPPTCQCDTKLSPADYFGKTMIENLPDSISVGIINVAIGGCDIRLFDKDVYKHYALTYKEDWFKSKVAGYGWNPYKRLIDMAKLAQKKGVVKGILLHQGETNTGQIQWPFYVQKIYNDMLEDLSLEADSVPILAGEMLQTEVNCCDAMIPIVNILPEVIPNAYIISSKGCTAQDNAHFDSEGYRLLGSRYAYKMLEILGYQVP